MTIARQMGRPRLVAIGALNPDFDVVRCVACQNSGQPVGIAFNGAGASIITIHRGYHPVCSSLGPLTKHDTEQLRALERCHDWRNDVNAIGWRSR